jgi:DNA-binding CsgD family transcriptional regulator
MDWILRRTDGPEPDAATLRMTALGLLEAWNTRSRILITADDAQWWDPGSVDVLGFVIPRLHETVPVVITTRPDVPPGVAGFGPDAAELRIPPLAREDTVALLRAREIPVRLAGRIHATAGGNPRLVVDIVQGLEGVAPGHDWLDAIPLSAHARPTVRGWLAELPEPVSQVLFTAALAADPSVATIRRAAGAQTGWALALAETAGLVTLGGDGTVAFQACAVRDAVIAEASAESTRRAHHALAAASPDPTDRLWHAVSASTSARIGRRAAAALENGAQVARERGDHTRAAQFLLLAAERAALGPDDAHRLREAWSQARGRTPAEPLAHPTGIGRTNTAAYMTPPPNRIALLAEAAVEAGVAGRFDLARIALARLDKSAPEPGVRARACIAVLDAAGQGIAGLDDIHERAVADARTAGDPALLSAVHLQLAWHEYLARGYTLEADDQARRALGWAERSGDPECQVAALVMTAEIQRGRGRPEYRRTLRRALGFDTKPVPGRICDCPQEIAIRFALLDDRIEEARAGLRELLPVAEREGGLSDLVHILGAAVRTEARAGNGHQAKAHAHRLLSLCEDQTPSPGPPWYAAALAELAGGTLEQALTYATLASAASAQESDTHYLTYCLQLSGTIRLLSRDTAGALADLLRVRDLERAQQIADPATVRYHADLAEALVAAGQSDEALAVIAAARRSASVLGRRGVLAALDRAEAVHCAAAGDFPRSEALLNQAADMFEELGYPLERARVLLAQSAMENRRRRFARARALHDAAEVVFRASGAPVWEPAPEYTDDGGPDAAGSDARDLVSGLTDSESKVARLVAEGYGNRDIAARLFISVKTVEAVLTRVYRKLGMRSRIQLSTHVRTEQAL